MQLHLLAKMMDVAADIYQRLPGGGVNLIATVAAPTRTSTTTNLRLVLSAGHYELVHSVEVRIGARPPSQCA